MATSISKAQGQALADGFFDTLGSSKDELRANNSLGELIVLAGGLVTNAQANLNKSDRVATGALSESLKVLNPEKVGTLIQVDVEAFYYFKFVDAGVAGNKSGSSTKGYRFKDKMPPISAIRKWVIREGLKAKTNVGGRPITKREARRKSITDTSNQTAFIISKGIQIYGLKTTNFFVKAVRSTQSKSRQVFGKAFKLDIINSLPKTLNG